MDWRTFIVELLKALAWPAVVLTVVLLIRKPLLDLIPYLQSAKLPGVELAFGEQLRQLEEKAEGSKVLEASAEVGQTIQSPQETLRGHLERLAEVSPRAAISEAWRAIEAALIDVAGSEAASNVSLPYQLTQTLHKEGRLGDETLRFTKELRQLRNEAVHSHEANLSVNDALKYIQLAEGLIALIKRTSRQSD